MKPELTFESTVLQRKNIVVISFGLTGIGIMSYTEHDIYEEKRKKTIWVIHTMAVLAISYFQNFWMFKCSSLIERTR